MVDTSMDTEREDLSIIGESFSLFHRNVKIINLCFLSDRFVMVTPLFLYFLLT